MQINYIYRSKVINENSIENVFDTVYNNMDYKCNKIYVPYAGTSILSILRNIHYIYEIAKKKPNDIFHITGDVHYCAIALIGRKTVLTIHDLVTLERSDGIKKSILNFFWYTIPLKICNRITAISKKTYNDLINHFPYIVNKTMIVSNPVNDIFMFKEPSYNQTFKLLQVGTRNNKNLERVIQACYGLNVQLTIIGKLNDADLSLLKKNKIDYVNFYNLEFKEVVKCYEETDIVMFVSLYEGFGLPIIESQTVGRPVISSNIEPMISVSNNSCILVNPYDYKSIQDAILLLMNDKTLYFSLVNKGLENSERFSSKKIANDYKIVYDSIIKGINDEKKY